MWELIKSSTLWAVTPAAIIVCVAKVSRDLFTDKYLKKATYKLKLSYFCQMTFWGAEAGHSVWSVRGLPNYPGCHEMESQFADLAVDRDLTLSAVHIDTDQKGQSPHHHRSASQKV